jgi:hypothetical protein
MPSVAGSYKTVVSPGDWCWAFKEGMTPLDEVLAPGTAPHEFSYAGTRADFVEAVQQACDTLPGLRHVFWRVMLDAATDCGVFYSLHFHTARAIAFVDTATSPTPRFLFWNTKSEPVWHLKPEDLMARPTLCVSKATVKAHVTVQRARDTEEAAASQTAAAVTAERHATIKGVILGVCAALAARLLGVGGWGGGGWGLWGPCVAAPPSAVLSTALFKGVH